ncbi:hypothetical protein QZH41_016008 [Actinostola sp. cb2023]|nr:hypothetical protein QZH41_016008 [Actinostola sp. cb2023]
MRTATNYLIVNMAVSDLANDTVHTGLDIECSPEFSVHAPFRVSEWPNKSRKFYAIMEGRNRFVNVDYDKQIEEAEVTEMEKEKNTVEGSADEEDSEEQISNDCKKRTPRTARDMFRVVLVAILEAPFHNMSEGNVNGMFNESRTNGTGFGNLPVYPEGLQSVMGIMRIVSICCYVAILVLSTLGNTAIVAIVFKNQNMQTKANVLIVNMAISDLVATIFTVPRMIDVEVSRNFLWKVPSLVTEVVCKFSPFVREVSCAVSIFSLVGIALDRFFAIVIPLARKPAILHLKCLIPMIWLVSMGINAFYFYAFRVEVSEGVLKCIQILTNNEDKIFDSVRFVMLIAVPLLALILLYSTIAIKMTRQNIPGASVESFAKSRRQQNRNIIKLSVVIVAFFAICWVPYYIGVLLQDYLWHSQLPPLHSITLVFVLQTVFTILTYASYAVNPYVCLVFSSNFRRGTRRMFCSANPFVTRVPTRITTSNWNVPRAISMSNLDISIENPNGPRTIPGNNLDTSLENDRDRALPNTPTESSENLDEPYLEDSEDPANSTAQRIVWTNLDEPYLEDSEDTANPTAQRIVSTNLDEPYLEDSEDPANPTAQRIVSTNLDEPYLEDSEDPANPTAQRIISPNLDEPYMENSRDIPGPKGSRAGISASLTDSYLKNLKGDLNKGFEM